MLRFFNWKSWIGDLGDFPELDLSIACGAGTYIRAIARDLGAMLNAGGTLACLTRTESSGFSIDQSLSFEELELQLQEDKFCPLLPSAVLGHLGAISFPLNIPNAGFKDSASRFPKRRSWDPMRKVATQYPNLPIPCRFTIKMVNF